MTAKKSQRNREIIKLRKQGLLLKQIGLKQTPTITKQRVWEIVHKPAPESRWDKFKKLVSRPFSKAGFFSSSFSFWRG